MKRKKLNMKKIISLMIFLIFIIFILKNMKLTDRPQNTTQFSALIPESTNEYEIIKKDQNNNYSGIGQQKIDNKDGYFTTFTTTNQKTYIEYKQNYASWSKNSYWNDNMENSGCGITSMAIILSGYGKKCTPEDLRKKYYPVIDYENLSTEFAKNYGIQSSGFFYDTVHLSEEYIKEQLQKNRPALICVWDKPTKNRWTTTSHYMVLLATDNELVYISNPNGGKNDSKSSGWYPFKEVVPYIAKVLFFNS